MDWSRMRLPLFIAGIFVFFAKFRYFATADFASILMAIGVALTLFSFVCGYSSMSHAKKNKLAGEARAIFYAMYWQWGLVLAVLAYLFYCWQLGNGSVPESNLQKIVVGVWVLLAILSISAGVGLEYSFANAGRGPLAEPARVLRAGRQWLLVGMMAASLLGINYAATRRDHVADWSYLKTSKPSDLTFKIIESLTKEVEIVGFFASDNEVTPFVRDYLDQIKTQEKLLKVSIVDADLDPVRAETLKVAGNGRILMRQGDQSETIQVGTKIAAARGALKQLDGQFQKTLLRLTQERRRVYFTDGHGELTWLGEPAQLRSITALESYFSSQNFQMRRLGLGEGSGREIPSDAQLVVVAGPSRPFLPEEARALKEYVERGGKLLAFLDPENEKGEVQLDSSSTNPLITMLSEVGLIFDPQLLANDRAFVSATRSPADHWFLFSNVFTSHATVTGLSNADERMAVIAFRAGTLAASSSTPGWNAQITIKSLTDSFVDVNKNFTFDAGAETRRSYGIAAVSEQVGDPKNADPGAAKKGRVVVMSDATAISDPILRNHGNLLFVADAIKWLVQDGAFAGMIAENEEDVRIQHTNKQEIALYYGTILGVPFLVIGFGGFATRRTSRKKKAKAL